MKYAHTLLACKYKIPPPVVPAKIVYLNPRLLSEQRWRHVNENVLQQYRQTRSIDVRQYSHAIKDTSENDWAEYSWTKYTYRQTYLQCVPMLIEGKNM
jgi:hypothetical protein